MSGVNLMTSISRNPRSLIQFSPSIQAILHLYLQRDHIFFDEFPYIIRL